MASGDSRDDASNIGILKSNREKEEDLVATGILGGTVPRRTRDCRSSLGDSPVAPTVCPTILRYPPILSVTGTKLLRTAIENTYGKTPEAVDGLRQMKENTFRLEQKLFLHFDFEPHELPNML
jgi:hypothetical protein